jgi:uncharacterized SAM-binding protein YcdF (DUF218 family)
MIWFRLFFVIAAAWTGAFIEYVDQIKHLQPQANRIKADAVVALTGGTDRLEEGMRLLADGCCRRLLISGVHVEVTRDEMRKRWPSDEENFDCCVDLDHAARDTIGNAIETARWAAAHQFKSIIVVTASYHMPRSLLLIGEAAPGLELIPQPVTPERLHMDAWWSQPNTVQLLGGEFNKYLISLIRYRVGMPAISGQQVQVKEAAASLEG